MTKAVILLQTTGAGRLTRTRNGDLTALLPRTIVSGMIADQGR